MTNLIGNKQAIKGVLANVVQIVENTSGYPFRFFTEATLDLAEDDELMHLMADAHIEVSSALKLRMKPPCSKNKKKTWELSGPAQEVC